MFTLPASIFWALLFFHGYDLKKSVPNASIETLLDFGCNRATEEVNVLSIGFSMTYISGANGIRTHDLLHAMQALSQLSYGPLV